MAEKVIVELPEDLAQQVRTVAARTQRSLAEVVLDWIRRAGADPILELLSDEELLAVFDHQPDSASQEELSELLESNQEGSLLTSEKNHLDELMQCYRTGQLRKAQALKEAVRRGLRPRLG